MKKLLLSFSILAGSNLLNAQIYITQWDIVKIGTVVQQSYDTTKADHPGMINPGASGANKTWMFSSLKADSTDTMTVTNPNWLSPDSFPTANLASINSADGSITYLKNNSSGLYAEGIYADPGTGTPVAISFNPEMQMLKFVDQYASSFMNHAVIDLKLSINQPPVDSVRVKQIIDKTVLTDGTGSITTPLGTYNALRHSGKQVHTDTIWVHYAGNWVPYQTTLDSVWHFEWWATNVGFALLSMDSTTADSVRNIQWLKTIPVLGAVHDASAMFGSINIYPNPTTSQLNFEIKNADVSAIEIFDLSGKRISSLPANKNNLVSYNAESLSSGTYFYRAIDSQGNTLSRGKFDVVK